MRGKLEQPVDVISQAQLERLPGPVERSRAPGEMGWWPGARGPLTCSQVIAEQAQHPLGEHTRREQVMAVVVHGEFGLDLPTRAEKNLN